MTAGATASTTISGSLPRVRDPRVDPTRFQIVSHSVLLVAAFVVLQFPQFLSGSQTTAIMAVLFALSFLSWPRTRPLLGPFVGLVVMAALSITWSEHPSSALNGSFQLGIVVASGIAVGTTIPAQRLMALVTRSTAAIGLVSLILAVVAPSIAIHSGPAYAGTLQGIYISKNSLAVVLVLGAISTLFRRWPTPRARWSLVFVWAIYIVALVRADSATADVILLLAVMFRFFYGWWIKASGASRGAAFAVVLAPAVLLVASAWTIYDGALELLGRDATLTGRTNIWEAAITAWQTKPWLGVGWNSFSTDSAVAEAQFALYGWVRDHAHNGYVQVLTELGIVGAAVLATTLTIILIRVLKVIRATRLLAAGWPMALFMLFITHNFAEQSMRLLPMFALAMASAAAARLFVDYRREQAESAGD